MSCQGGCQEIILGIHRLGNILFLRFLSPFFNCRVENVSLGSILAGHLKGNIIYFHCVERDVCPARAVVRKSFSTSTGSVTYQALKLMGGAHNHGEQAERVLVDYAKYKLRIIVTEKKEWREKTMKQVYLDFVDSFTADMEEERKSLFSVIFPSYEKMQDNMRKWKKGRTRLEKEGNSKSLVRNLQH